MEESTRFRKPRALRSERYIRALGFLNRVDSSTQPLTNIYTYYMCDCKIIVWGGCTLLRGTCAWIHIQTSVVYIRLIMYIQVNENIMTVELSTFITCDNNVGSNKHFYATKKILQQLVTWEFTHTTHTAYSIMTY